MSDTEYRRSKYGYLAYATDMGELLERYGDDFVFIDGVEYRRVKNEPSITLTLRPDKAARLRKRMKPNTPYDLTITDNPQIELVQNWIYLPHVERREEQDDE